MEIIEQTIKMLVNNQVFALECLGLTILLFFIVISCSPSIRKKITEFWEAEKHRYPYLTGEAYKKYSLGGGKRPPAQKLSPYQAAIVAEQEAINGAIERGICRFYWEWHRLHAVARFILCVPACAAVTFVFFCLNDAIIKGATTFAGLEVVGYVTVFMSILTGYITIYFFMSRFRFLISGIGLAYFLFLVPVNPDYLLQKPFHILAAGLVAWTWVKAPSNRPKALIRLFGKEFVVACLCHAYLVVIMMLTVFDPAKQLPKEQILSLPFYKFFEPFVEQTLSAIHLHVGDMVPENILLIIMILSWSGILFVLGAYLILPNYETIAGIPARSEKITVST